MFRQLVFAAIWAALSLFAAPAPAQTVTSAGPDQVTITLYRDEERRPYDPPTGYWLGGYALVTETRTVAIPAGRSTIRFEGVASGILAESAILAGLPAGVREKNLDADLLSPYSLFAHSLGRPVTLIRRQDGKETEEHAILRSGPDGAAVVETRQGFLAVDCGDRTRERLAYDSVPPGLSARPTLSVEIESPAAVTARITLSYLAWNFDWQANYVATMRPDGRSAELFAWITLASNDVTSFADAQTMVVAGKVESDIQAPNTPYAPLLQYRCFFTPLDIRRNSDAKVDAITAEDIGSLPDASVTEALMRVPGVSINRFAEREALGDLNLYRVPEPTNVAAHSSKQVGLLARESVAVDVVYRGWVRPDGASAVQLQLRTRNREDRGLGLPLPAGTVAVFEPLGERRVLVGEGSIADKAVGEEIEIPVTIVEQVQLTRRIEAGRHLLTVTNANRWPVRFEAEILQQEGRVARPSQPLASRNGNALWAVDVPANGAAELDYRFNPYRRPRRR